MDQNTWEGQTDLERAEETYAGLLESESPFLPETAPEEPEYLGENLIWGSE